MNSLSSGYGMNFSLPGQQVANTPVYSTNQNRLQIDLNNPNDPLFGLFDNIAGTNLTISIGSQATETLKNIHHGLGYVPQVFLSFFGYTPGTVPNYTQGTYEIEQFLIAEGGFGIDVVDYVITEDDLTIRHDVDLTGGIGSGTYTSTAASFALQIKYLICNNVRIHTPNFQ
jgi:hypothetical protein